MKKYIKDSSVTASYRQVTHSYDDVISKQAETTIKAIEKFKRLATDDSWDYFDSGDAKELLDPLHAAEDAINYYVHCRTANKPYWV